MRLRFSACLCPTRQLRASPRARAFGVVSETPYGALGAESGTVAFGPGPCMSSRPLHLGTQVLANCYVRYGKIRTPSHNDVGEFHDGGPKIWDNRRKKGVIP